MHGGISISLDVKKAFDSLKHDFLEEAMREAQFNEDEIQTILFLHSQACLYVGKPEHDSKVYLGTGVHQGCSLSPLLWALATGKFYRLYQQALTAQHLPLGSATLFADDVFGSWAFLLPNVVQAGSPRNRGIGPNPSECRSRTQHGEDGYTLSHSRH